MGRASRSPWRAGNCEKVTFVVSSVLAAAPTDYFGLRKRMRFCPLAFLPDVTNMPILLAADSRFDRASAGHDLYFPRYWRGQSAR